ncbi:uncharacterized protein LOC131841063 [Achroia grisella]|uniref:uncharacterized protein LOC131841063 n=1 Tax=Achroia grisella TaxID=688607 RepID=UPI0027D3218F|nr:uncharacterized protein LOC131841063 [Achroia grisella]
MNRKREICRDRQKNKNKNKRGQDSNKALESTIEGLRLEINDRDQELLSNDVEIVGIPEENGESVDHLVLTCVNTIGVALDERDIVSCARFGRLYGMVDGQQPRPRPVVVRLAHRATRDKILRAARVRRTITTEGMGLRSNPQRLHINERLTRTNRRLFYLAREAARRLGWRFTWTRDGRIFTRRGHGTSAHRIRVEADLDKVFGSNTVSSDNTDQK